MSEATPPLALEDEQSWGTAEDWRAYMRRERDRYRDNLHRVQTHLKYAIAERDTARADLARVTAERDALRVAAGTVFGMWNLGEDFDFVDGNGNILTVWDIKRLLPEWPQLVTTEAFEDAMFTLGALAASEPKEQGSDADTD